MHLIVSISSVWIEQVKEKDETMSGNIKKIQQHFSNSSSSLSSSTSSSARSAKTCVSGNGTTEFTQCTDCGSTFNRKTIQWVGTKMVCVACYNKAKVRESSCLEDSSELSEEGSKISKRTSVNDCPSCLRKITPKDAIIFFDKNCWHSNCFKCTNCKDGIRGGSQVFTHNEKPYCRKCHIKLFVNDCARCGKPVVGHSRIFNKKTYHPECLTCFKCHSAFPAGKDSIYTNGDKNYCKECCLNQFGKTCHKCSGLISPFDDTEAIVYKGQDYHGVCFLCTECHKPFGHEESILSGKVNTEDIFCLGCYNSLFGRYCSFCKQIISGMESSCSSGEYQWHKPRCLKCKICKRSLVGQKLIINDDGSTICPKCYK